MSHEPLQFLFSRERIRAGLLPPGEWKPFPDVTERAGWQAALPGLARRVRDRASAHTGRSWPELPATLFAEYRRNGNRSRFQDAYFERRGAVADLALAECLEGEGRHLDDIVNGVWAICEESTWCLPAHERSAGPLSDIHEPQIDLFGAETGATLAWVSHLVGPALEGEFPEVPRRIGHEVDRRLLEPYLCVDDWQWLRGREPHRGPNNWNPWIHSNLLVATLLLEQDVERRASLVARMVRGLDAFLDGYAEDGGCDEGSSYWWRAAASMFECVETLYSASAGRLDGFGLPLLHEMGRYFHRMHVGADRYVNFGDAPSRQRPSGEVLYRYGGRVGDEEMRRHALSLRAISDDVDHDHDHDLGRRLADLFDVDFAEAPPAAPPLVRDTWLGGVQVLACREREGSTSGLFLAAKGGHNGESHNHNDAGSFVVGLDGTPVLIDVGVETYTARTFGPDRYGIWTMQSGFHNLPVIDGHDQRAGSEYRAASVTHVIRDEASGLSMDLAPAYPAEAGVRSWTRAVSLERGDGAVRIVDRWEMERDPGELALHLMSSSQADCSTPGVLVFHIDGGRNLVVEYDRSLLSGRCERIAIEDPRLAYSWGEAVHRTILRVIQPTSSGTWELRVTSA